MLKQILIVLALSAFVFLAYGKGTESKNVVVIVLDATRPDHLGCYGYPRNTSPNIDRLCEKSVVFDHAMAQAIWTKPSVATIFTSKHPSEHGAYKFTTNTSADMPNSRLPDSENTLAEVLGSRGYETAAFVSNHFILGDFNLGQGFGRYAFMDGMMYREKDRAIADESVRWMGQRGDTGFFAYVHIMAAHSPYNPPPQYPARFRPAPYEGNLSFAGYGWGDRNFTKEDLDEITARYDGNIAYADEHVGVILDALEGSGRMKDTVIIITADHGESLGEHGHIGHSRITDSVIRVPLIIYDPRSPKGRRAQGLAGLIDLSPTILSLLDIPAPKGFRGLDLFAEHRDYAVVEGYGASNNGRIGVTDGRFLYILDENETLYDLENDPYEFTDIVEQEIGLTGRFRQALAEHQTKNITAEYDLNDAEKLKALGYMN